MARVEAGLVGGLTLVGVAGPMTPSWGRRMSPWLAARYGNALDDFIVADNVELPWPNPQGHMAGERRVVSLEDIFSGELLALCVRDRDVGPQEGLGGGRVQMQAPSLGRSVVSEATGRVKEMASLLGRVVVRAMERVPLEAVAQGSPLSLSPLWL